MGRQNKKRKHSAAAPTQSEPTQVCRRALEESVGILSWDGATDADVATACIQLSPMVKMLVERNQFESADVEKLVTQLAHCCAHQRLEVRSTAWSALCDCAVEAPALAEAAVDAKLHEVVLRQLRETLLEPSSSEPSAAGASSSDEAQKNQAAKRLGLLSQLMEAFRLMCQVDERPMENLKPEDYQAFCDCTSAPGSRREALDLLLVLTDGSSPDLAFLAPVWCPLAAEALGCALLTKAKSEEQSTASMDAVIGAITLNVVATLDGARTLHRGSKEEASLYSGPLEVSDIKRVPGVLGHVAGGCPRAPRARTCWREREVCGKAHVLANN